MAIPYYLAFTDEAQSISVLYTTTTEYLYEDRYGQPYPSTVKYTDEMLEDNGATFMGVETTVTPNYANISVLGTVYEPAPIPTPEDYVPVPYPAPNYGVNVLVIDGEDASALEPYAIMPSPFPQRVWAI